MTLITSRDAWVSLHVNGELVYISKDTPDPSSDIECISAGRDINEAIVLAATKSLVGEGSGDLAVKHDSQMAFVFSTFPTYHQATILERRGSRTGQIQTSRITPTEVTAARNRRRDLVEAVETFEK